ncbi:hypothetical protein [Quadrisphaera setariae]|uniref:Uncharacterized protein n=1 Tax=Quadrisphaera setariae TaxID=2593304 RepID=A0A5C8ZHG6_9ACTN|nr:hypothetical protein [Quadrisphaera setariae]TXR56611.1 hypothetical protein FMM08_07455 [Quadrisphaera setariae]
MTTPDRGALRAVRSAVLALFVVGLSAVGHAAAGGHLPGPLAATGLVAAVLACCWLATRWHLPAGAAVLLLAGSQVALHAALEALAPTHHPGAAPAPALAPHLAGAAGLDHTGHLATAGTASSLWLGGPSTADATMLLAHVVVASALALVYSRGEDAVWALCAWLAPLAAVVVALVRLPVAPRPRSLPAVGVVVPTGLLVLRAVRRRGPPAALAG